MNRQKLTLLPRTKLTTRPEQFPPSCHHGTAPTRALTPTARRAAPLPTYRGQTRRRGGCRAAGGHAALLSHLRSPGRGRPGPARPAAGPTEPPGQARPGPARSRPRGAAEGRPAAALREERPAQLFPWAAPSFHGARGRRSRGPTGREARRPQTPQARGPPQDT